MGRLSTRTQYQDPDIYQSQAFLSKVKERDRAMFTDWIGGMTGHELAKKYFLADISARQRLTIVKRIYDDVKRRECDAR